MRSHRTNQDFPLTLQLSATTIWKGYSGLARGEEASLLETEHFCCNALSHSQGWNVLTWRVPPPQRDTLPPLGCSKTCLVLWTFLQPGQVSNQLHSIVGVTSHNPMKLISSWGRRGRLGWRGVLGEGFLGERGGCREAEKQQTKVKVGGWVLWEDCRDRLTSSTLSINVN